ncbi:MAG: SCO family protein [Bryobacterales bacterium]|nr:SCO family protein [Bryobacterales bacterium]
MIALIPSLAFFVAAGIATPPPPPNPVEDLVLYRSVPDISVRTPAGETLRLSQFAQGQPLLVTLVFARCSGICYPFLRSLRAAAAAVPPTTPYRVVVLSFDERDTPKDMRAAASGLGLAADPTWLFATASPADVRTLSAATGFWFTWDPQRRQYDHPAVLLALRGGRLIRLFTGPIVSPPILGAILWELSGGFVRSYPDPRSQPAFRCFQFDPATRTLALDWGALFLITPAAFALLVAVVLFGRGPIHT